MTRVRSTRLFLASVLVLSSVSLLTGASQTRNTDATGCTDHPLFTRMQNMHAGRGVGPLAPVATNDSEEGRAKNRRVELVKQ